MKKSTLFLMILFFPFYSMGFTSPPAMLHPPIDGNWLDPMQQGAPQGLSNPYVYINLDQNEELELNLIVTTTDYQMQNYDSLLVRWTVGAYSGVTELITKDDMSPIDGGYYQAVKHVEISFLSECSVNVPNTFRANILLELVTPKPGGYDSYPMTNNQGLFNPIAYNNLSPFFNSEKMLLCWGATPPSNGVGNNDLSVKSSSVKKESPVQESLLNQENESDSKDDIIQDIAVYPNPFSNTFQLQYYLEKASDVQLRIFDVHGSLIQYQTLKQQSPGLKSHSFNFEDQLSSGLYLMHLYYDDRIHAIRLIKK